MRALEERPSFLEPSDVPFTLGDAAIRYCPWCGIPLRNERGEVLAAEDESDRAVRSSRLIRLFGTGGAKPHAREIAANDITPPGYSEPNSWTCHVCDQMPDTRALRTFDVRRLLPPSPDVRMLRNDSEPSEAYIDRLIFGVFLVLGVIAMIRFILTH